MATDVDLVFETHMGELGLRCRPEYKFYRDRKWRADYVVSRGADTPALIEIEGGAWTRGRHTRGNGFIEDLSKYNHASALGYKLFRFTPDQVRSGEAKEFIKRWL
jgi:hypothetical protein